MIIIHGAPDAVFDHDIGEVEVTHFFASAQVGGVGGEAHILLPSCDDALAIATLNGLCRHSDGAQARPADLIDGHGGFALINIGF